MQVLVSDLVKILYSFRRCPYAIRARMALVASAVEYEHREILLRDKPDEMLEKSPKGTVPVLIIGDRVIDESLDVMYWALCHNDPNAWLDITKEENEAANELIKECDGSFKYHLDRYKYSNRYPDERESYHRFAAESVLKVWCERVSEMGHLIKEQQTLADIAIFPFVRQYRNHDESQFIEGAPLHNLQIWLDKILKTQIFSKVMWQYPVWKPIPKIDF